MVGFSLVNLAMYLCGVLTNQLLNISASKRKYKQTFLLSKYLSENWPSISIAIGSMLPFVMYTNDIMGYVGVTLNADSAVGLHCYIGGLLINVIVSKLQKFIK